MQRQQLKILHSVFPSEKLQKSKTRGFAKSIAASQRRVQHCSSHFIICQTLIICISTYSSSSRTCSSIASKLLAITVEKRLKDFIELITYKAYASVSRGLFSRRQVFYSSFSSHQSWKTKDRLPRICWTFSSKVKQTFRQKIMFLHSC